MPNISFILIFNINYFHDQKYIVSESYVWIYIILFRLECFFLLSLNCGNWEQILSFGLPSKFYLATSIDACRSRLTKTQEKYIKVYATINVHFFSFTLHIDEAHFYFQHNRVSILYTNIRTNYFLVNIIVSKCWILYTSVCFISDFPCIRPLRDILRLFALIKMTIHINGWTLVSEDARLLDGLFLLVLC